MKEHPILFSAPMVQRLLAGRKFVTRRLSKQWLKVKAGDRLWARETWEQVHPLQVSEGRYSQEGRAGIPGPPAVKYRVIYRADGEYPAIHFQRGKPEYPFREQCVDRCAREHIHPAERWRGWVPSIHMPRWASRILLECEEDARLERLMDITEDEAIAEGILPDVVNAVTRFVDLWHSLHTKPGERWEDNPEVVRVGRFRRITQEPIA